MYQPPFFTLRAALLAAAAGAAVGVGSGAMAQTADAGANAAVLAQRQYDQDLAACNSGSLPTPQREACTRDAGARFDRLRGLPPSTQAEPSADGRATVVTPNSGSSALRGSTTTTTSDGRATVVVPGATVAP